MNRALVAQLKRCIGPERFRGGGRLVDWRDGIVPGMDPRATEKLVHDALRRRLHEPVSATALCVYTLLPWAGDLASLSLCGISAFREIRFEVRLPTGARGTPPVIHALAIGEEGVVGITARRFDYVAPRTRRLASAYTDGSLPRHLAVWQEMTPIKEGPGLAHGRHIDGVQLMKLALGLARIFPGQPIRLLYLFLEPEGCDAAQAFRGHRAALGEVSSATREAAVAFVACSFHELWASWTEARHVAMRGIVAELGRRYTVAMPI